MQRRYLLIVHRPRCREMFAGNESNQKQTGGQRARERWSKGASHPSSEPTAAFTGEAALLPASFLIGVQHGFKTGPRVRTWLMPRQSGELLPDLRIGATQRA